MIDLFTRIELVGSLPLTCEYCGSNNRVVTVPARFKNQEQGYVDRLHRQWRSFNAETTGVDFYHDVRYACLKCIRWFSHLSIKKSRSRYLHECFSCGENGYTRNMVELPGDGWLYQPSWACRSGSCYETAKEKRAVGLRFVSMSKRDIERRRVWYNNKRAKKAGLPSTLTFLEWLNLLHAYEERCAYCNGPFSCMDHIWPISEGGGTTAGNVVPCCAGCNAKKHTTPMVCTKDGWTLQAIRVK